MYSIVYLGFAINYSVGKRLKTLADQSSVACQSVIPQNYRRQGGLWEKSPQL